MPVYMNMFAVVDGSGNKPKYGEETMTGIYATANRYLAAAAGLVMPWAYEPYTLKYKFSFGNPVQGPTKVGDPRCSILTSMLRQETSGWLRQFYEQTSLFVNVFFVWKISNGYDEDVIVRGVTLNSQTVLIDTTEAAIGGLALAHEIGHALMGPGHVDEEGNLMHSDLTFAGPRLNTQQLTKMRDAYGKRTTGAPGAGAWTC
jgi:hypothetical protein